MKKTKSVGLGYVIDEGVDTSIIEEQKKKILEYKSHSSFANYAKEYLDNFYNLVDLDYVERSDKLENIVHETYDEESRKIKLALFTKQGILDFVLPPNQDDWTNKKILLSLKNNIEFRKVFNGMVKNEDFKLRVMDYNDFENIQKQVGVFSKLAQPLTADMLKDVELVYLNKKTHQLKVLPNKNHMLALKSVVARAKYDKLHGNPLSMNFIEKLNGYLFMNTEREGEQGFGAFRRTNVRVGYEEYWKTIIFDKVSKRDECGYILEYNNSELLYQVKKLVNWFNNKKLNVTPLEKAAIINLEIARMQPFRDGNKRTARLLTNYSLLLDGYPTISFHAESKEKFDRMLQKGIVSKNITEFAKYLNEMIQLQQEAYIDEFKKVEYLFSEEKESVKPEKVESEESKEEKAEEELLEN